MPEDKSEIILSILSASVFVLLIVFAAFLLFRIYLKKKNKLLLEGEKLKLAYEQTLFRSKIEMQEQVFTQISQEIHDNIGQVLSLVRLNINTLGLPEERISSTDELLARAITDLRHLSHNLNTNYIRETGFTGAVRQLLDNLSRTRQFQTAIDGIAVDTHIDEEKAIILFRIVQEVINNIVRHANATFIKVHIVEMDNGFQISISDNGVGFDTNILKGQTGLGIRNMTERAKMIGAGIEIESIPGSGSMVTLMVVKN